MAAARRYASSGSVDVGHRPAVDFGIADRADHDDVVAGDERQRRNEVLLRGLLVELGEQHEQSATAEAHDRLGERAAVVGLDQLGLEIEHRLGHAAHLGA